MKRKYLIITLTMTMFFPLATSMAATAISSQCIDSFANSSWDAFAAAYRVKNTDAFICDSNKEVFTGTPFDLCNQDCQSMGFVGGVCESGACHDGRAILNAPSSPKSSNCNWISDWYTASAEPCCCVNARLDRATGYEVVDASSYDQWWINDPNKKPILTGYSTPASPACLLINSSDAPVDAKICSPGAVSGCKVCNAAGTTWVDTDSKCAAGQTCSAGVCASSCTPNCLGKNCGSNGCGGSCGNCAGGQTCSAQGQCQTAQTCFPGAVSGCKVCNAAGTTWVDTDSKCPEGQLCFNGACATKCPDNMPFGCRVYNSSGILFDDNSKCPDNGTCLRGICVSVSGSTCVPRTCAKLGFGCGLAFDGCGNPLNCGACSSGQSCKNNICTATISNNQANNTAASQTNNTANNTAKNAPMSKTDLLAAIRQIMQQLISLVQQLKAMK